MAFFMKFAVSLEDITSVFGLVFAVSIFSNFAYETVFWNHSNGRAHKILCSYGSNMCNVLIPRGAYNLLTK